MRAIAFAVSLSLLSWTAAAAERDDLTAARALFERNLDAIRQRDRDAYLACYLHGPSVARTGPTGFSLGFEGLAAGAGSAWPDSFDASDLRLAPVQPGVVYGTYRYRVRYGADEHGGLSERVFLKTPQGWRIAVTTAFDAPAGTPPPARALVGATLVDGTGATPVKDAVVVVKDGTIACASTRAQCPVPEGVASVDVSGHWIVPGLVDAHVHFSQTGWADGRPDALDVRDQRPYEAVAAALSERPERFFRSDLCSGVTAVFDVGGYPWTVAQVRSSEGDLRAPHLVASGPLLSTIDHWVNLPAERQFIFLKDAEAARDGVRYLAALGSAAVKVWYVVNKDHPVDASAAAVMAAGEAARGAGLPLIVHATGLAEAKGAVKAGAKLLVHGVMDLPVDDEFVSLAKQAGTIYCPTLTVSGGYLRMFDAVAAGRAPEIDDPNGCVDPETRARVAETAGVPAARVDVARVAERRKRVEQAERVGALNLARMAAAGVPIAMGTDAGNPLTLHGPAVYAEMEAMQRAGLSAAQVLVASTRGGASALGMEKRIGTLEPGKVADLLVVAADPTVDVSALRRLRYVMRGGVLRSLEELSAVARTSGP